MVNFLNIEISVEVTANCHLSCEYRGAAHNTCNISAKHPDFIPVISPNQSGYDSHVFSRNLFQREMEKFSSR